MNRRTRRCLQYSPVDYKPPATTLFSYSRYEPRITDMPNHNTGNRVDERISDIALDAVAGGTSAKNVFGATWDQLKASAHMALGGSEEALGKLVGDMSFIPGASELGSEWVQTGTGRWMEGLSEANSGTTPRRQRCRHHNSCDHSCHCGWCCCWRVRRRCTRQSDRPRAL